MSTTPSSTWMPRFAVSDSLALWRAAAAPRTLLVMLGAAAWTLGLGWMATMVRFNQGGYEPVDEQRYLNGMMAALFVFAVPATCGVVVSEVSQELLRRPLTNRLPRIAERTGSAACTLALLLAAALGTLAYAASSPASVLLGPNDSTRPTLLAYVALALLGYPAGAWLRGHLGPRFFWLVRLCAFLALTYGAVRIVAFASDSLAAGIGLLCVGAAATWNRFHPRICWGVARSGMPTTFQFLAGMSGGAGMPVVLLGDGGKRLPSGATGGSLRGWWAAYRYEQRTLNRSMGQVWGLVVVSASTLALTLLWPLLRSLFQSESTGSNAAWLLGGAASAMDLSAESALRTALLMVGGGLAAMAVLSSSPFAKRFPYPIPRTQRATLALLVGARNLGLYAVCFVGLTLLVRISLLPLLGIDPGPGVPPILRVFLAQSVLFAPYVMLSMWGGYRLRRGARWSGLGCMLVGLALLLSSADSLHRWADAPFWNSWGQVALGFASALLLGFTLLGFALSRHYRRCDLA